MVTKGFLMFWGGIAGIVLTSSIAVLLIVKRTYKGTISAAEVVDIEKLEIEESKNSIAETVVIMPDIVAEIRVTEAFVDNADKMLPDTQIIEKENV